MSEPEETHLTPLERRAERFGKLAAEYEIVQSNLSDLDDLLDNDWVGKKLVNARLPNNLYEYTRKMHATNVAFTNYITALETNENMLPDERGGDHTELATRFRDIRHTLDALRQFLPPDEVPSGFVERLMRKEHPPAKAEAEGASVITEFAPEAEEKPKPKAKKNAKPYILPGRYEAQILETIRALESYAKLAAPLLGVTLEERQMTAQPNPHQKVLELREFGFERIVIDPVSLGVPAGWVRKLNLRLSLSQDSTSPELA